MSRRLQSLLGLLCCGGAAWLVPPRTEHFVTFASWCVRPIALPFAWRAVGEAEQRGDPAELFRRGQQVMQLLPSWTDGYGSFAYRFALAPIHERDGERRGALALAQLQAAIAWLEQARPLTGRREFEILQVLAFLPEVACRVEPELARRLQPTGGAAAIMARYMAELERRFPGPAVHEQRTFFAPNLAAALLGANQPHEALAELRLALARAGSVRDQALAAEWAARIDEVARWLAGDHTVDLTAARADTRLAPLLPWLR